MKNFVKYFKISTNSCFCLGCVMLCFSVIMIIAEIILRRFFSSSLYITDEYTGYLLCGIATMGMAFTLREKGHIRMTIFYAFLPGKWKIFFDKVICVVGFVFFIYLASVTGEFFGKSLLGGVRSMGVSQTYIAIPQLFMPLGFFVMALQFLECLFTLSVRSDAKEPSE